MTLALAGGVSVSELARRFGVSRKTVYKWKRRYEQSGEAGLVDRSRRPHHCPHRTPELVEQAVLRLRAEHPRWGGRKLHHRLKRLGLDAPAPSTITRILREHGLIDPIDTAQRHRWQRFEHDRPNDLWQRVWWVERLVRRSLGEDGSGPTRMKSRREPGGLRSRTR